MIDKYRLFTIHANKPPQWRTNHKNQEGFVSSDMPTVMPLKEGINYLAIHTMACIKDRIYFQINIIQCGVTFQTLGGFV